MAQLLSPVCADALKFHKPLRNHSSGRNYCRLPKATRPWALVNRCRPRQRGGCCGSTKVGTQDSFSEAVSVDDDYYSVLGLLPDATMDEIKKAYYNCMKACHPDLCHNNANTTNFCIFINEVYSVLSDPVLRTVYDEIHGYTLTAINPFLDDSSPKDHVFVDEFSCIGCKNCANVASDVFEIEEDYGRARAYNQSGNPELVQQAIDTCPVDCIHWTSAAQVSLLEDEMRRIERVNLAAMLLGAGSACDVFKTARSRWERRHLKLLEQARRRMVKRDAAGNGGSMWNDLWGRPIKDCQNTEEENKERSRRAAAAARRWRGYSRRGSDQKPSTFKLPPSTRHR